MLLLALLGSSHDIRSRYIALTVHNVTYYSESSNENVTYFCGEGTRLLVVGDADLLTTGNVTAYSEDIPHIPGPKRDGRKPYTERAEHRKVPGADVRRGRLASGGAQSKARGSPMRPRLQPATPVPLEAEAIPRGWTGRLYRPAT